VELLARLPTRARYVAGALFVAFWLAAATAFIDIGGNAMLQDGRYVLNDRGVVTVVDKATYDRLVSRRPGGVSGSEHRGLPSSVL
jgi:hypothetical protein